MLLFISKGMFDKICAEKEFKLTGMYDRLLQDSLVVGDKLTLEVIKGTESKTFIVTAITEDVDTTYQKYKKLSLVEA